MKAETLPESDFVSVSKDQAATEDRRDQSLVRPKVLILAPFKQMAFQIIEQIIFLCNSGRWKKVSKKKKFRAEFENEEEAFNDFFRIGISFVQSKKSGKMQLKLYEQFYASDIIVASPLAIRMLCGHKLDDKANELESAVD